MLSIRASHLDQWRYYLRSDNFSDADLNDSLFGLREETVPQWVGTEFHLAYQSAIRREVESFMTTISAPYMEGDDINSRPTFRFRTIHVIPHKLFTSFIEQPSLVDLPCGVRVYGTADMYRHPQIWDIKTTKGIKIDEAERRMESYQWRAYLEMFGAYSFRYLIFQVHYDPKSVRKGGQVEVRDYISFENCRYPEMTNDLNGAAADLAAYCKSRGVTPSIGERYRRMGDRIGSEENPKVSQVAQNLREAES